jgi:signal transduction histidine kinase
MRILHLEDNENDQILVREMLHADGLSCDTVAVKNENDFEVELAKQHFDIIISDFSLPSGDALKALAVARERSPHTPFIFFSGTIGEEVAVETLRQGATDYVLKQRPKRLTAAVRNAMRSIAERLRVREMEEEMRQLESQLLRAQRMESLGALVGGIAHDLNNALVPIIIGIELLEREKLSAEGDGMLQAMESSARRSAELVRQMLLFARGGQSEKTDIDPAQHIKEIAKIISETFPKSIRCRTSIEKTSWHVQGVPTQLHQVLLNLCVNARDAMPRGGTLTLSVENLKVPAADALRHGVEAGNYLCISVADTGEGIPPEATEKIFQPFFTTKGIGKGTGLGLSTCRSIVKNHAGFIVVRSKVGEGSEFRVYLPAGARKDSVVAAKKVAPPSGNGERILVVDDEETILAIARAALQNFGYKVIIANGGIEAVSLFSQYPDIRVLISDLAMPLMDGRTTVAELRKLKPDIKVIIASGTEKELEETLPNLNADGVIVKPFTSEDLLETVHRVLTNGG